MWKLRRLFVSHHDMSHAHASLRQTKEYVVLCELCECDTCLIRFHKKKNHCRTGKIICAMHCQPMVSTVCTYIHTTWYFIPISVNPSCRQITAASARSYESSQMVPHSPPMQISTRPSFVVFPPTSRS